MKYVLIFFVLLQGCQNQQQLQTYIHYYKDARTNMCFAGYAPLFSGGKLTYVPCTPEVEKLLEPWPN